MPNNFHAFSKVHCIIIRQRAKINKLISGWGTMAKVLFVAAIVIASQVGIVSVITAMYHSASAWTTTEIPILPIESTVTPLADV